MEQDSNLQMQWKSKIIAVYAFTFAAVAVLIDYLPLDLTGHSSTIASAFMSFLKVQFLPSGWLLIESASSAKFETDAMTSALLAFLVCSPIAAYGMMRLISPPNLGKGTFVALVVGMAAMSYAGAAWGLAVDSYYLASISPFFVLTPVLSSYDFYTLLLRGILGWVLVFILPIYLAFFVEFRRARGLRWLTWPKKTRIDSPAEAQ